MESKSRENQEVVDKTIDVIIKSLKMICSKLEEKEKEITELRKNLNDQ